MKKILFGLVLFVSFPSFSQLDSVDFSMSFVTNPSFTAGLDAADLESDIFKVNVFLNDVDYVGKVMVMVYDLPTNSPMAIMKLEREEILSGAYSENGFIVFNIPYLDPAGTYKVILETQNFQQAYLPRLEKSFPTN